jgi:hypothetical protein
MNLFTYSDAQKSSYKIQHGIMKHPAYTEVGNGKLAIQVPHITPPVFFRVFKF